MAEAFFMDGASFASVRPRQDSSRRRFRTRRATFWPGGRGWGNCGGPAVGWGWAGNLNS